MEDAGACISFKDGDGGGDLAWISAFHIFLYPSELTSTAQDGGRSCADTLKTIFSTPKTCRPASESEWWYCPWWIKQCDFSPMNFFSSLFADQDSCRGSKLLPHLLAESLGSPAFSPTAFYDNISRDGMNMPTYDTSNEALEESQLDVQKPTPYG